MRISDWSSDACSSELRALSLSAAARNAEGKAIWSAGVWQNTISPALQGTSSPPRRRCRRGEPLDPYEHLECISCRSLHEDTAMARLRSEEHTSELQSLMRISYAVFCLNKKTIQTKH